MKEAKAAPTQRINEMGKKILAGDLKRKTKDLTIFLMLHTHTHTVLIF